jgi:hypothetical protein
MLFSEIMTAYRDKHTKYINRMFAKVQKFAITAGKGVYVTIKTVRNCNLCYRRHVLADK